MSKSQHKNSYLPWLILALGAMFLLYEFVLQVAPGVMTSQLMSQYHVKAFELGTALSFYYISYGLIQLVAGACFDHFGARWTLFIALVICILGTALVATSSQVVGLSLGRFLTGFGSATAYIGVMFIGRMWFGARHFTKIVRPEA